MSRASLLAELGVYRPSDEREARMVHELAAFVRAHAGCFKRSLSIGHVTASAWIVDEDQTHALLTHHRKLGRWLQLGGHADGDEDVRRVARREAQEESGLMAIRFATEMIYDVDIHAIPELAAEPAHRHYDIRFAFIADRHSPLVISAESHELAWVPIASLDAPPNDASVRRLARKTPTLERPAAHPRGETAAIPGVQ